MANTTETYQNLLTSEYQGQPNFEAMIAADTAPLVQIQAVLASMIPLFDLGTPPVGNQLDIIGQWVGVSRDLQVPVTGVLFTWNGTVTEGWNRGIWADASNSSSVTVLTDAAYLTLIQAKIAANRWDGTTEGAYAIWSIVFPNLVILIQDNENMSFAVAIQGTVLDSLTEALLTDGLIPLKPEGVRISAYYIPVDTNPLFGWNMNTAYVQGWGTGSWANEIAGL